MSCYKYSQPNTATYMGARPRMPGSSFNSTQLGTKATIWKRVLMISVSCFSVITPTMQFDSIRVFTRVPGMLSMQALTPYAWLPGIDRNGRRATVFGGRVWKLWQPIFSCTKWPLTTHPWCPWFWMMFCKWFSYRNNTHINFPWSYTHFIQSSVYFDYIQYFTGPCSELMMIKVQIRLSGRRW